MAEKKKTTAKKTAKSQQPAANSQKQTANSQLKQKAAEPKPQYRPGKPFLKSVKSGGVLVEFTKSPTGLFGLAYNPGEKARFSKEQSEILFDADVAKKA